jgi:hypothetical protein
MSFMEKARQAAEQARQTAGHGISSMTTPEAKAEMRGAASQVGGHVRGAAGSAKRGLITAIEKIDPGILADIIIKATAIQEVANRSLRNKGSTYRIGEITITATIPPQIGFSIVRLGDEPVEEVDVDELLSSSELAATMDRGEPEVVALDGDVVEAVPEGEPLA